MHLDFDYIFKRILICDSGSPYRGQTMDIGIKDGIILSLAQEIEGKFGKQIVELKGACVSPGWFDLMTEINIPGNEQRGTLESTIKSAKKGGYTGFAAYSNGIQSIDTAEMCKALRGMFSKQEIQVELIGAFSKGRKQNKLSEMYEMYQTGTIGFSDGTGSTYPGDYLYLATTYLSGFNGLLLTGVQNSTLVRNAISVESADAAMMGFKSYPEISEEIELFKILKIQEHTNARIHFIGITTKNAIELFISKKKSLKNSVSFTPQNLFFTTEDLSYFNPNLKWDIPLGGKEDQQALINGIKSGMFDSMITCHQSRSTEDKEVEFWTAVAGMSGLETAYASANTALVKNGIVSIERLCELMGNANRRIIGLEEVVIKEGSEANLTFFSSEKNWTIREADFKGPYPNSPFIGKTLTGKPEGIFYSGNFQRCDISEIT